MDLFLWRITCASIFEKAVKPTQLALAKRSQTLYELFNKADENQDGYLTYAEFKMLLELLQVLDTLPKVQVKTYFDLLDEKDVGLISYEALKTKFAFLPIEMKN